jgi:predicted nucleic acid-binding protein
MIALDTNTLTLLFVPHAPHPVQNAKERIEFLVSDLHGKGEQIVIPTPVLAELLVKGGAARNDIIQTLNKSSKFLIAPFDIRAAIELSVMTDAALSRGDKKNGIDESWHKITLDRQIVAISKVSGATVIYSDDAGIRAVAKREGLTPYSVEDIKIPQSGQEKFWKPQ